MYPPVVTRDPTAVEVEVQAAYLANFPDGDRFYVPRIFGWAIECFTGSYRDYQAVDAHYHDFEHTLQGTLCLARLLRGRHLAGAKPEVPQRMFQLTFLAMLLHDSGYLKKRDDTKGTGAKYTITHVERSADFAEQLMFEKGFSNSEILAVQNMIRCTGVNANLKAIPFQSEVERIGGLSLATADLLGQMAAEDYVQKLPILYSEFAEAVDFTGDLSHFVASFSSADELVRRTPEFWKELVLVKLDRDFGGLYRFLNAPYPAGANYYMDRIQSNMDKLSAEHCNPRCRWAEQAQANDP